MNPFVLCSKKIHTIKLVTSISGSYTFCRNQPQCNYEFVSYDEKQEVETPTLEWNELLCCKFRHFFSEEKLDNVLLRITKFKQTKAKFPLPVSRIVWSWGESMDAIKSPVFALSRPYSTSQKKIKYIS